MLSSQQRGIRPPPCLHPDTQGKGFALPRGDQMTAPDCPVHTGCVLHRLYSPRWDPEACPTTSPHGLRVRILEGVWTGQLLWPSTPISMPSWRATSLPHGTHRPHHGAAAIPGAAARPHSTWLPSRVSCARLLWPGRAGRVPADPGRVLAVPDRVPVPGPVAGPAPVVVLVRAGASPDRSGIVSVLAPSDGVAAD